MVAYEDLIESIDRYTQRVNRLETEQIANMKAKEQLEKSILELKDKIENDKEALDIVTHAIEILRAVSDESVKKSYEFIEKNLNNALSRMFTNTVRKIRLKEFTLRKQYPQLELELIVGNGKVRSLKTDSGHGLAQIVSLLCILTLIVITDTRRILIMDEVIYGLSSHNMKIITDIMWTFTEIGFQFICNDHGFVPEGAKVYHLEMVGDVSSIKETYISTKGSYKELSESEDEQVLGVIEPVKSRPVEETGEPEHKNNPHLNGGVLSL